MRILILEDDRATAQLLGMLLTSLGHTIAHAIDGTEGIKQLRASTFDLVISDVQMVPVDGFGFLASARTEFPRTLVVMASAFSDLQKQIDQQPHKPFDAVHKPFRIEEVRRVLLRAEEALAVQANVARAAGTSEPTATAGTGRSLAARLLELFPGTAYTRVRAGLSRAMGHSGNALVVAAPGVVGPEFLTLWRESSPQPSAAWRILDAGRSPAEARAWLAGAGNTGPDAQGGGATSRGGTLVVLQMESLALDDQARLLALSRATPPTRLIVTVRRDPDLLVEDGVLSEELYFRISSMTVPIPSLTELAEHLDAIFIDALRATPGFPFGAADLQIEPVALSALRAHPWPENLAELRGVAVWTAAQMRTPRVTLAHLPQRFHRACLRTLSDALAYAQREYLGRVLRLSPSTLEAAQAAGVRPDQVEAGAMSGGPLLFSMGTSAPVTAAPVRGTEERYPSFLFVSADNALRHAAEAQLAGLGLEVRVAVDGLQAIAQTMLAVRRPRIAILAGPAAPFVGDELLDQLLRITPGLIVATLGSGEENERTHSFPALESMDLFPVIVAHLLQAAAKAGA